MHVLVTGASGYIGGVITEYLMKAGHTVSGLSRSDESAEKIRRLGADPVPGDLRNPAGVAACAARADAVVHTAMAWGPDSAALDQQMVRATLEAMRGSGKAFVYTSGVWVIGDTKGRVAGELTALRPPALAAWRPAVEKMVIESRNARVEGVVIRPAMVYGRGGGTVGGFVRQARTQKLVRIVGTGSNHWSFIHVDALGELYVRAVEQTPGGELFLAADGPAFTVRIVAETVATMNEARVELWPVDEARKQIGAAADALVMDQRIMSTKAGRMLGWAPKWPNVLDEIRSGSYVG
ncbi:MAG: NAD-dependent epimerase/dehydratase family protein [Bryobacterales bacterium]|nr:NAD-dependent epimerase/dehydratase family protein [Bryobacterales bacterium]